MECGDCIAALQPFLGSKMIQKPCVITDAPLAFTQSMHSIKAKMFKIFMITKDILFNKAQDFNSYRNHEISLIEHDNQNGQ